MELKQYKIIYRSRYYPLEGNHSKIFLAPSKKVIRENWHAIIHTDEYVIVKIEEVKHG